MSDCEYNLKDCGCGRIIQTHPSSSSSPRQIHQQSKQDLSPSSASSSSSSATAATTVILVGLVPSNTQPATLTSSLINRKRVDGSCACSSNISPGIVVGERGSSGGGANPFEKSSAPADLVDDDLEKVDDELSVIIGETNTATNSISSLVPLPPSDNNSNKNISFSLNSNQSRRHSNSNTNSSTSGFCGRCISKMTTCRVILVLLLVKCLILSFVIPVHLIPASSTDSEYPPHSPEDGSNGNGDHSAGDEDGHTVTPPDTNAIEGGGGVEEPTTHTNGDNHGESNGSAAEGSESSANGNGAKSNEDDDDDKDNNGGESQGESAGEAAETTEPSTGASSSEGSASVESSGGSCSGGDASMGTVLAKIESLMDAVKNIDSSIDKMETLVQSTMIDERVYKCMSAISNGNQTQALKYWKQILRYLSTPQKQAAIFNQLIRDSYGGSEDQILPVIQFIDQTTQYYGYYTLFNELPKHNHLYKNTAVFTLGHFIKKSCGRDSTLFSRLPGAVQSVFADFFTLQNKYNKGYLYYAKRCVAKHYFHCLDVLTKRIDPYVLDGLADDSEEKKRYHWKLNATDSTVTKFFILNHDKYWTYRLQDLNNSPRFKMEEAGSNAEIDLAHFQLKLNSDDEIIIQVGTTEDYLEEEDFKSDKAEVRLHSFHQADGIPDSPRMYWLANPVGSATADDGVVEPDSCNIDLALVPSPNGNGNGSSK